MDVIKIEYLILRLFLLYRYSTVAILAQESSSWETLRFRLEHIIPPNQWPWFPAESFRLSKSQDGMCYVTIRGMKYKVPCCDVKEVSEYVPRKFRASRGLNPPVQEVQVNSVASVIPDKRAQVKSVASVIPDK